MPGEDSTFKAVSNVCHEAVGWPRREKENARTFTKYPSGILMIWGSSRDAITVDTLKDAWP